MKTAIKKEAQATETKKMNGVNHSPKVEKVIKINTGSAEERMYKLEAMNGLKLKYDKIKTANHKLEKFKSSTQKDSFVLKLQNESGEVFETSNAFITGKILEVVNSGIGELRAETEKEILAFEI